MNRFERFLLIAWLLPLAGRGQFTNTGAQIVVSGGNLVLNDLDLVNNGPFIHTSGTVQFTGNSNSIIAGSVTPQFSTLALNKTGATVQLQTGITINDQILFTNGLLNLNNNNIILNTAAYLNGENESSRITGPTGGYVQITSLLNAPSAANPGNLGVVITSPANLGSTVIRRGHVSQTNGSNMGNSIFRYYDILPANNTSLQATIGINYFDAELNGLGETMLSTWKSANTTVWANLGTTTRNTTTNYVDRTNQAEMARFTLSSELYALPMTITALNSTCVNNQVVLSWQTRNETHTNHFIISRSSNGTDWEAIAAVPAARNNAQSHTYRYTDEQSFNGAYYHIVQQEMNGSETVSALIRSSCAGSETVRVYPNPTYGTSWLQMQAVNNTTVVLRLYDYTGALVKQQSEKVITGLNQFDLQMNNLPQGIYSLVVSWGGRNVKTVKVVKL